MLAYWTKYRGSIGPATAGPLGAYMEGTDPLLIPLGDVPAYLATLGINKTRATIYNWAKFGVRGHRLWTVVLGGDLRTSKTAVDEFLATLNRR